MPRTLAALVLCLLLTSCTAGGAGPVGAPVEDPVGFDSPGVALPETKVRTAPSPSTQSDQPSQTPSPPTPSPSPAGSVATDTSLPHPVVLAWDGIGIVAPSVRTEVVGLHQSNHDGARDLDATGSEIPVVVMESRERGTGLRGAADIVVHPDTQLVAPVTGTVKRAGTYTLYCDELDDFLVIEPDGHPGIEVKLLHVDGVQVAAGDRVEAGVTIVAPRPTKLPFASQVDELSGPDDWPHVHLEVVDTSIPDRPNSNSGSDDC